MSRRALASITAALAAVGCSLLVPLDYTGGTEPARASRGGQSGTGAGATGGVAGDGLGGTLSEGGANTAGDDNGPTEGGSPGDVGGASGGTTEPGTGGDTVGGMSGTSGNSTSGGAGVGGGPTAGTDATGGMDTGGFGGSLATGGIGGMSAGMGGVGGGGRGGRAGRGGMGGMSGTGAVAGNADCPDADLSTDPANCGSCGHACADGIVCEGGLCITSPCVGMGCVNPPMACPMAMDGYRVTNMSGADNCWEALGYLEAAAPGKPSIVSWNFSATRKLEVNGVSMGTNNNDPGWELTMPVRGGGYCVHATPGKDTDYAGLKMPIPGEIP
jgi:hypothetical protein